MPKLRIFVDFWNFQIELLKRTERKFSADWKKFPKWLVKEAEGLIGGTLDYQGTRVYLSYNPRSSTDKNLHHWARTVLGRLPGIDVTIKERKYKGPPVCQKCHGEIVDCPLCGSRLERTVEKGVDTAIVTDLLGLSWENTLDVAVLVTSDADFIPAVELLATKGFQVVNAHFPPLGSQLAQVCWASINLSEGLDHFKRKIPKSRTN